MSTRTTIKTLRAMVDNLNTLTGNPVNVWTRQGNQNVAHVGAYVLDAAYGGYRLAQMVNASGGERDITGRSTASGCAAAIRAFQNGLTAAAQAKEGTGT